MAVAACGDDPGFGVAIDNRSSGDVIVVFQGADQNTSMGYITGSGAANYVAPAHHPPTVSPWIGVGWSKEAGDYLPGIIRVYRLDCSIVAEFTVRPGRYLVTVSETGAASLAVDDAGGTTVRRELGVAPQTCP